MQIRGFTNTFGRLPQMGFVAEIVVVCSTIIALALIAVAPQQPGITEQFCVSDVHTPGCGAQSADIGAPWADAVHFK